MVAVKEKREKEEREEEEKAKEEEKIRMERRKKNGECRKKPRRTSGHTDTKAHSVRRLSILRG